MNKIENISKGATYHSVLIKLLSTSFVPKKRIKIPNKIIPKIPLRIFHKVFLSIELFLREWFLRFVYHNLFKWTIIMMEE